MALPRGDFFFLKWVIFGIPKNENFVLISRMVLYFCDKMHFKKLKLENEEN